MFDIMRAYSIIIGGENVDRSILHCDLNNFYASVECADNPDYSGHPLAVGGREEMRHGIVLAKNQLAKGFGIKTGDTIWMAKKKCPEIIIVMPHFNRYYDYSKRVKEIYLSYTQRVESFGIDECWLDITGCEKIFGSPAEVADEIRIRVKREIGLTISVGVSFNKVFAKLGSDYKKPDAVTQITRENYRDIVWPLSVSDIIGVGKATAETLGNMGVKTIGELANFDAKLLKRRLGINGEKLWCFANGKDDAPVLCGCEVPKSKSIGRSITLPKDITSREHVWKMVVALSEEVMYSARKSGLKGKNAELSIKDSKLEVHTFNCTQQDFISTSRMLAESVIRLYDTGAMMNMKIRAIGVRIFNLYEDSSAMQMSFFSSDERNIRDEILEKEMESIRKKYGRDSIMRGIMIQDMPYRLGHKEESQPTFGTKV